MTASRLARDRAEIERLVIPDSTVSELEVVLPRRYRRLAIDDATDRAVWLDTSTPALLEVAVSAGEVVQHALACDADFAAVLTNELKATTSPRDAIDWLESAYGSLLVMESFRRGVRLAVSTFPLVIESCEAVSRWSGSMSLGSGGLPCIRCILSCANYRCAARTFGSVDSTSGRSLSVDEWLVWGCAIGFGGIHYMHLTTSSYGSGIGYR